MRTNQRVDKVLNFIPEDSKVADIGCDHGYVLIEGVFKNKIISGIGVEISKGPYGQALENVRNYKLQDKIEIRMGDGLNPLNIGECDICVIGGMGGKLIADILDHDKNKTRSFKRLILQPMNSEKTLRKYLVKNGWKIIEEEILVLDRLYLYIVAEKGEMNIEDDFLFEIGPILAYDKSEGRNLYVLEKIKKIENILAGINKSRSGDMMKADKFKSYLRKWRKYIED